ncbi:ABC transporter ATP-binding protein/permease [bacterium 210820-DFI.6.37]|nr:ABC transporter ATP-binding protein/permease [bacterium 210820-DFI.6.37]
MKQKTKQPSPFSVLWKWAGPHHGSFIYSVLLAVFGVASSMIPYFCIAAIIKQLLSGNPDSGSCVRLCLYALAGYCGKVLFANLSTAVSHTATFHTLRDLRKALMAKLSRVPLGTVLDTPSGQYKTTIVDRVEGMESTLAHLIPEMTSNALIPAAILIYLFILDWRMALASLFSLIVGFICAMLSGKTYAARWEGAVKAGHTMADAIVEYIGGIQVVKAFSQSAGSYRKYADAVNYNANYYVDWMRDSQKYMCMWTAVIPSVLISVLPVGFALWAFESLSLPDFLTIIVLSLGLTGPIIAAMSFVDDLAVVGSNVAEISAILDAPELIRPDTPVNLKDHEIRLKDVSFSYNQESGPVLDHINLEIHPGTVTALVGPSGSGKSTIAKLIAGFWDVTNGAITLGGQDLRAIPQDQQNSQIAYVSQDTYLFDRTIRENIRMGRRDATDEEVEAAARAAGCHSFITALDHGYDTMSGGSGGHLSGGEKQRVSIARAILKDAPIIILDEATASIDPENEASIQRALSALAQGKTLIVIAHRLSTIADADQIVVIQRGKIAGRGTQQQLLASCPLYASMWQSHLDARDKL